MKGFLPGENVYFKHLSVNEHCVFIRHEMGYDSYHEAIKTLDAEEAVEATRILTEVQEGDRKACVLCKRLKESDLHFIRDTRSICGICEDEDWDIVFQCGHHSCNNCYARLTISKSNPGVCPCCRKAIIATVKLNLG